MTVSSLQSQQWIESSSESNVEDQNWILTKGSIYTLRAHLQVLLPFLWIGVLKMSITLLIWKNVTGTNGFWPYQGSRNRGCLRGCFYIPSKLRMF